jgi:AcrR family transcriptional regulator
MTKPARSEDAILAAALDLMAEHGVTGLTVDAVAARAGVGKQTIYRHWGSRARLVHDAIACTNGPFEEPDTGSLRGDLEALLRQIVAFLSNPASGGVFPSLLEAAERDPELAELRAKHSDKKRALFVRALERASQRGELAPGVVIESAVDLIVGPVFYRRIVAQSPLSPKALQRHLDLVLRALLAESEKPVEVVA